MQDERYIDFHTHHPSLAGECVIQDGIHTRGRHPWHLLTSAIHPSLTPSSSAPSLSTTSGGLQFCCSHSPSLLAIGESGLDRLCDTPYALQLQVFREEVALSEQLQLPLFLHCVRAIDDVLRIRHELHARQPIIWHGYRGGAEQIQQLLKPSEQSLPSTRETGRDAFYFSFGYRHNREALIACPLHRLLLETDDDVLHPIADLYATVADQLGIHIETLIRQMHKNFHTLFRKES
ncbi:MAG: TatD family hydrolase [Bacteroidaceae bacterium]|nr:TatD family hydrolase [Bacteroidaceae bacterium]